MKKQRLPFKKLENNCFPTSQCETLFSHHQFFYLGLPYHAIKHVFHHTFKPHLTMALGSQFGLVQRAFSSALHGEIGPCSTSLQQLQLLQLFFQGNVVILSSIHFSFKGRRYKSARAQARLYKWISSDLQLIMFVLKSFFGRQNWHLTFFCFAFPCLLPQDEIWLLIETFIDNSC